MHKLALFCGARPGAPGRGMDSGLRYSGLASRRQIDVLTDGGRSPRMLLLGTNRPNRAGQRMSVSRVRPEAVTSPWDWNLTLVQFDRDLSKRAFCCDLCSHSNLFPQRGKLYRDHVYQAWSTMRLSARED